MEDEGEGALGSYISLKKRKDEKKFFIEFDTKKVGDEWIG